MEWNQAPDVQECRKTLDPAVSGQGFQDTRLHGPRGATSPLPLLWPLGALAVVVFPSDVQGMAAPMCQIASA